MSLEALITILGMAAVTYRHPRRRPAARQPAADDRLRRRWMKHIPGAVLASLVAPAILAGGPAEAIAAAATALSIS